MHRVFVSDCDGHALLHKLEKISLRHQLILVDGLDRRQVLCLREVSVFSHFCLPHS